MKSNSIFALTIRRFRKHRMAMLGMITLAVICILVLGAPLFSMHDPYKQDLLNRFQAPSLSHWMGTDDLGRDVWARVLYGGRVSLSVGLLAMFVSIAVGSLVGLVSGFYGGIVDSILSRITEIFLSIPRLFVLLALGMLIRSLDLPYIKAGSFGPIAFVIGVLSWMGVARIVRGATFELREREFILAARAIGAPNRILIFKHILPNVFSPVIVSATLGLAGAIISESGLSYLGFGVQLPTPTWGNMLSNTQNQMTTAPWTVVFPGLMIFIVVVVINYIGDGLRDALDPRHFTKV